MTSWSGVDLYGVDLWKAIANIQNYKNHPYSFYENCGYKIVGVVPDANGFGKPDIMMAKRVG
jgi:aminoglycoside 6'-N-acetyltransferase I